MRPSLLIPAFALLCAATAAQADDDRPEHFEGERSETIAEALTHLREYNAKLSTIIERDELTASEMTEIHQLSYTLENALARIEDEVEELAEVLEEVHIASEEMDRETVRKQAPAYLTGSESLYTR
ncbi:DUF6746 family protein [Algiphilus sp.]|uniref:DUF6746 family protein n=1 Tax=Algiphilus sp. TaxID=1872431 RepID=UPI0025C5DD8F|nr:DUF6746 family protein [Algiphilus sp.]MCK5771120.1 hypothetical protein [Algiphilus sp.]